MEREADRQAGRERERPTDRQTDRKKKPHGIRRHGDGDNCDLCA